MNPDSISLLKKDVGDIWGDVEEIFDRIERRRETFRNSPEALDSMALQLHNLFGGLEQVFEAIARAFENQIEGARYHEDLLRRMRLEIEGVRPALLTSELSRRLDDLRRFRHFVRHAYRALMDESRVREQVKTALDLRVPMRSAIDRFFERLSEGE